MARNRPLLVSATLVLLLAAADRPRAQSIEKVYPLEPPDGGVMAAKGTLKIGVKGTDLLKVRFRIVMSRDGFDTAAYTFDQSQDKNGWAFSSESTEDEQPVIYFVRKPLADGTYDWRADAWNGVEWIKGTKTSRLRVDAVPPADVQGLRMIVDRDRKRVELDWDPVTTDRDGRPEQVARYKIYRYEKRSVFFVARMYEIGTTTQTRFVDESEAALKTPILYYKITAEDEVGNEAGRLY